MQPNQLILWNVRNQYLMQIKKLQPKKIGFSGYFEYISEDFLKFEFIWVLRLNVPPSKERSWDAWNQQVSSPSFKSQSNKCSYLEYVKLKNISFDLFEFSQELLSIYLRIWVTTKWKNIALQLQIKKPLALVGVDNWILQTSLQLVHNLSGPLVYIISTLSTFCHQEQVSLTCVVYDGHLDILCKINYPSYMSNNSLSLLRNHHI